MLKILDQSSKKALGVQLNGKVLHKDYETFIPMLEKMIADNGSARCLVELVDFGGFELRTLWDELGGFDERFLAPGGGLVNLDTYQRACGLPDSQLVVLLGEGTFHQVHGGVATNALVSPAAAFHEEYAAIRGKPFRVPEVSPLYLGRMPVHALASVAWSAARASEASPAP